MKVKIDGRNREMTLSDRLYDRDIITRKHTAFDSFAALVATPHYWPSVYLGGKSLKAQRELVFLSIAYNSWMRANNDTRRVFKGDWQGSALDLQDRNELVWAAQAVLA